MERIELISLAKSQIDLLLAENDYLLQKVNNLKNKTQIKLNQNYRKVESLKAEIDELERFYKQ